MIVFAAGCANTRSLPGVEPDPRAVLVRAADFALTDFPEPPPFNWGEGVLMAGMMRAGQTTGDERYIAFVQEWADHWREKGLTPVLEKKGYCGHWGPAFPVLMLYEHTGNEDYLSMAMEVVDFMQQDATRTRDGGLGHWRDNYQLWVDTLFMSCPVYATAGRLTAQPELIMEASRQLAVTAKYLQDTGTGLFYHMYDEPKETHNPDLWARGNGWTAMAYVETLREMPESSTEYAARLEEFRRLCEGLVQAQDEKSGLWNTVLMRSDAYLETSASAMILYSLAEGYRMKWIDLEDPALIQRAWSGLTSKVDAEGRVFDVSTGTGPTDFEGYIKIPRGTETWGTGAFLMAAGTLADAR